MPETKRTGSGVLGGLLGVVGLSAVAGVLVTAAVTPAIAVSGAAASSAISMFDNMPSYLEIDELMLPTTLMYVNPDNGQEVEWTKFYDQNRSPVNFDQVAPVVYDAVLSSEDPRYYQHGGVDLIGTTRALLSNASGGQTQGGSSISQQYVKNVLIQRCERDAEAETDADGNVVKTRDEVLRNCWEEATNASGAEGYERKLQEMRYAIALEQRYSKNDILLGYLNIANFGGTNYGIDASSKYYFNVPASQLSISQAATLAGIVQNPNTYRIDRPNGSIVNSEGVGYNKAPDGSIDDVEPGTIQALYTLRDEGVINDEQLLAAADGYSATKGRQLYVLSRMLDDGKINRDQYIQAAVEPITPVITQPVTGCQSTGAAAYFCQYVVSTIQNDPAFGETREERDRALRQDGLKIYTTLDPRVQIAAEQAMADYAPTSIEGMEFGATATSVEAKTGRVLAIAQNTRYVPGATEDPNESSIVFAGDTTYGGSGGFGAGSTFKLFTLIDWLEQGKSLREVVNGTDRNIPRMTSCAGDWVNPGSDRIRNFGNQRGYNGTPLRFTAESLNTGFIGMAAELDLCDITSVVAKMGVTKGNGEPINVTVPSQIIGVDDVSPIAMAGAYATVANGGTLCQPKVIDRVVDNNGVDRPELVPVRNCSPVLTPEVASTAAFALQGVMVRGGTGAQANPFDGTPMIGKTGTNEQRHSWMIESSTNVTTAVMAGNVRGTVDIARAYAYDRRVMDIRYPIAQRIQATANAAYGGDDFPPPAENLIRQVVRNVPNVVGQTIDQARATLEGAGWEVAVGEAVDSDQPTNIIVAQNPSGQAPAGSVITINPSNGQAVTVPDVSGQNPAVAAGALNAAGFSAQLGSCTPDPGSGGGRVTGTDPGAGTATTRGATVTINFAAAACPGQGGPGNDEDDDE
ncbi:transglycosylase domain-containing protein [Microbacterium kunmingense]|uniref:transglycosylase domain-containing protein n=1 Tax=Microbacterium kunmingense TaxID=2915939 RepID=UPI003D735E2E